jgi:hypothetical protein
LTGRVGLEEERLALVLDFLRMMNSFENLMRNCDPLPQNTLKISGGLC